MSVTVSPDGSGITSFSAAGPLPGSSCTFSGITATYAVPIPIADHAFADTTAPFTFSGSFPGAQSAQGTLRHNSFGCDTGDLAWSATTTATPPSPTPGPAPGPGPAPAPTADTTAPPLLLRGGAAQRVLRQRAIVVVARSVSEACTATAKGRILVQGRTLRLRPVTKQLAAGAKATFRLRLTSGMLTTVRRALDAGRRPSARVTVVAKDPAGTITTKRLTITLRR